MRLPKFIKRKAYWIQWDDSSTDNGWVPDAESKVDGGEHHSLGFFIDEDDRFVVFAQSIGEFSSRWKTNLSRLTIPKVCILDVWEVG